MHMSLQIEIKKQHQTPAHFLVFLFHKTRPPIVQEDSSITSLMLQVINLFKSLLALNDSTIEITFSLTGSSVFHLRGWTAWVGDAGSHQALDQLLRPSWRAIPAI